MKDLQLTNKNLIPSLWQSWFPDASDMYRRVLGFVPQSPAVNLRELEDKYMMELAVPGYSKEDFSVELAGGVMSISAQKEKSEESEDEAGKVIRREFSSQSFSKKFTLPANANEERVSAKYEDGILKISVSKVEEEDKPASSSVKVD